LLLLLPVEKLAVIALDTTVAAILRTGNTGVTTLNLTIEIGNLIETEVNLRKIRMSKDSSTQWARRMIKDKPQESLQLYTRMKKVLKDIDGWTWDMKVRILRLPTRNSYFHLCTLPFG
jgi:hypothetical protein